MSISANALELVSTRNSHRSRGTSSASLDAEFAAWWRVWPRRVGKGQARKAYEGARRKVSAGALLRAVEEQHDVLVRAGQYCPHPSTWLNGERWEDDVAAIAPPAISQRQRETDDLFARATARAFARDAVEEAGPPWAGEVVRGGLEGVIEIEGEDDE
ncbi:MAG: hypothetical protein QM779_08170 [Propionicimonas sp.]|uniref:hypothetical protein n=1 Tax=Propionicimonas sp. TaxID=1955623 RepID=UPI003D0B2491